MWLINSISYAGIFRHKNLLAFLTKNMFYLKAIEISYLKQKLFNKMNEYHIQLLNSLVVKERDLYIDQVTCKTQADKT